MSDEKYIRKYETPEGFNDLWMCGDGEALAGLWFDGSRDGTRQGAETRDTAVFRDTCRWHRVIGTDASLTDYGGGLGNKISLLAHEGAACSTSGFPPRRPEKRMSIPPFCVGVCGP